MGRVNFEEMSNNLRRLLLYVGPGHSEELYLSNHVGAVGALKVGKPCLVFGVEDGGGSHVQQILGIAKVCGYNLEWLVKMQSRMSCRSGRMLTQDVWLDRFRFPPQRAGNHCLAMKKSADHGNKGSSRSKSPVSKMSVAETPTLQQPADAF